MWMGMGTVLPRAANFKFIRVRENRTVLNIHTYFVFIASF